MLIKLTIYKKVMLLLLIVICFSCRKSFNIEPTSSKLTVSIGQVNVFYSSGIINVVPTITNIFIPRLETFGICWAINNDPSITSYKSEKSISDNAQLDPNIIGLGFDIKFTMDTIYIIKAFVTFNDSLIFYSEPRTINLKDYN